MLGCTAPLVAAGTDALLFVADGRFHLEAMMIANPGVPAYRRAVLGQAPRARCRRARCGQELLPAASRASVGLALSYHNLSSGQARGRRRVSGFPEAAALSLLERSAPAPALRQELGLLARALGPCSGTR